MTTTQLAAHAESLLGQRLSETALEELLFSLEAANYVEWVGVVPGKGTVWDFTQTPERLADAIVQTVIARLP